MAQASNRNRAGRGAESSEGGYVLLAVVFMVALVVLSLAIAAPKVAAAIQRDRELEMVHRGEQYKRAIRLYYKKFGSYPSSIDQLEKTNNIRFLRKRYLDPLTGKDDWKLIHMGQAHVRPLGFFGQQLGVGSPIAGASPIGGSLGSGSTGSSVGFGSSSSSMGSSSTGGFGSSSPGVGSSSNAGTGAGAVGGGSGGGLYAAAGDDGSGTGTGTGSSAGTSLGAGASSSTTLGQGSASSTGFGANTSQTLGGAPVVGVMPPMTKATILQYKLKTKYNEWEFVYDPVEEQTAAAGILGGTGNINGTGNSVNGPGSSGTGTGSGTGMGNSFGSGGSSGGFGGMGASGSGGGSSSQTSTTPQ